MAEDTETKAGGLDEAGRLMRFEANRKSILVAYLLWFFLGGLGVHRFYLGRTTSALVLLGLTVAGVIFSVVAIGALILIVPAIWMLVDLFLIPGMTRDKNNTLIAEIERG